MPMFEDLSITTNQTQSSERNLEKELYQSDWICAKCHQDYYAQNLYAAMSNMKWQPTELFLILSDYYWTASWRHSGAIVANIRNKIHSQPDGVSKTEEYTDWYCSGVASDYDHMAPKNCAGFVSEGTVTDEIAQDLAQLGWRAVPYEDTEQD
jgi:hypothetical protein